MSKRLQAKLYSIARPATIRAVLVLVMLAAMALAAGAPHDWGGG